MNWGNDVPGAPHVQRWQKVVLAAMALAMVVSLCNGWRG